MSVTTDVERSEPVTVAISGVDAILAAVERCLDDLQSGRDASVTDT
jgi:hypothetical protein